MNKVLCMILLCLLLLSPVGCTPAPEAAAVLPPVRHGSSQCLADGTSCSFSESVSEADAIARIRIGNWLKEDASPPVTCFEAKVLQCFKGELPDVFTLQQFGCSKETVKGQPLYTHGNELLVFLKEDAGAGFESAYWILGCIPSVLDVAYDASGARYYVDRHGLFGRTADIGTNYANDRKIQREVYANAVAGDPEIGNPRGFFSYIFSEEDILALLAAC